MKFNATLAAAMSIAAFACSTDATADTGAPSRQEVGVAASVELVSNADVQVNDYARYLMLVDGRSRADAAVEARNYPTSDFLKVAQVRDIDSYARYLMIVDGRPYEEAVARSAIQDGHRAARLLVAR